MRAGLSSAAAEAVLEDAMQLLGSFRTWMLAGAVMLSAGAALGQSGQGSGSSSSAGGYGGGQGSGGSNSGNLGGYSATQGGGWPTAGQNGGSGHGSGTSAESTTGDVPQTQQQMEEQQARLRNVERQKQLVADTQKLVALANELQTDVDKSSKDMLSLDVIRKAEEIEKLAHSVHDRMKNAN